MADVVVFTPKAEVSAKENVDGFVAMCREHLSVFGKNISFSNLQWDVTEALQLKGHGRKRVRVTFASLKTIDSATPEPMAEPFCSFAKAYVRYQHAMRPAKNVSLRVAVLRAIESALSECRLSAAPWDIDSATLNRAAQILVDRFSESLAYRAGAQLELFARFLTENRLTTVPLVRWRHPIKRPVDTVRVGKEFEQRRAEKLPSRAALMALAKAFSLATEPMDVITTSFGALAVSSPDRANEILHLPALCEVRERRLDGTSAYGLRWFSSKGAAATVKWIVGTMVDVVEQALENIRDVTAAARQVAQWYEENPGKLYLEPHLEYLRGAQRLSMQDVARILWGNAEVSKSVSGVTRELRIPTLREGGRTYVRFEDVERAVLHWLPEGFPYLNAELGIKYSDALFVVLKNQFHESRSTYRCMIDPVTTNQINTRLGGRVTHGFASIFTQFGLTEDDGSPISISSHQFRHYLNTLAQLGGMSQLDIALWSSRKDLKQNAAYDHTTPQQRLARMRAVVGTGEAIVGPLASMPARIPISREEFASLKVPTAHETELGFCLHDFSTTPCELNVDCVNCAEHVCIKGDAEKTAMLQRRLAESQGLLSDAQHANGEGVLIGNDRGTQHLLRTNERLRELCAILADPNVPDGAVIQLSAIRTASRIDHAAAERNALEGVPNDAERQRLSAMAALLGDFI